MWVGSNVFKRQCLRESKRHQPGPAKDWDVGTVDEQTSDNTGQCRSESSSRELRRGGNSRSPNTDYGRDGALRLRQHLRHSWNNGGRLILKQLIWKEKRRFQEHQNAQGFRNSPPTQPHTHTHTHTHTLSFTSPC